MATLATQPETWEAREAEAHLNDLLDKVAAGRPQIIRRDGEEAAVLVPIEEWRKSHPAQKAGGSLLEVILSGPTFEIPDEAEHRGQCRPPIEF